MIVYKLDIMEALKEKGYTSYRLRQHLWKSYNDEIEEEKIYKF